MSGKSPINNILIDCSLKSYSMGQHFGHLIQGYAIWSWLWGIMLNYGPSLFCIAGDHGFALCSIAQDLHTNYIQKKSCAMQHSNAPESWAMLHSMGAWSGTVLRIWDVLSQIRIWPISHPGIGSWSKHFFIPDPTEEPLNGIRLLQLDSIP
jgi:hypothetical protein